MDPTLFPITLAQAFPALVPALDPALHPLPLATVRRLKAWRFLVQTLALSASRRRDLAVGELVAFPLEWGDRPLAGDWHPPFAGHGPGARTVRIFARAGLHQWRDVLERTPQQLLEGAGAGLMTVSDLLSCAIDLSAAWITQPAERRSAATFGVSRKIYPRRAARG